jgi:plasmid maintenance system antidote protein VapI
MMARVESDAIQRGGAETLKNKAWGISLMVDAKRTINPDLAKRLQRALTAGSKELHLVLQDAVPEVLRSTR